MAIQNRRGAFADFDPAKMVPGELAVVLSGDPASDTGRTLYICFAPGVVKRIVSYEDFETELQNATEEIQEAFTADVQAAINNAIAATSAANAAQQAATLAAAAANEAATAANAYVLGDISSKTVTFQEAENRENINSGESTATLFGKIKKWFTDLGAAAFKGVANNATTTEEGYVADARMIKVLQGLIDGQQTQITELNTNFAAIFSTTALSGSGVIPNFQNYKEYIVVVSANGYITSHYTVQQSLTGSPIFSSSYYYSATAHGMAAIQIWPNGAYTIAPGMEQNSINSSIAIYAR